MSDNANSTFKADYQSIADLAKRFEAVPVEVENIVNSFVHGEAPAIIRPELQGLIPVSNRSKKHAANNQRAFGRQENYNLAVKIITGSQFNYLVFPDEGLGTSKNNEPQNFTGRALENVMPELTENMTEYVKNLLGFWD